MSIAHRTGTDPAAGGPPGSDAPPLVSERRGPDQPPKSTVTRSGPRTRVGITWGCICAGVVALVIFMVQDTGRAIYFLWMYGSTSAALALLIAVVGAVLVTLILGTARITQARHLGRRRMAGKVVRRRRALSGPRPDVPSQ